ncbi:hypothetical protein HMF7854_04510 [Sphingomonas ginkgonis]|uniref:Uncharacterized protein n=1 Tax=Sphingomonas ginkgonis TaxID=2315330 RepID=A0A429V885_9SPHN|nr:hypothetical protein [Sphingomonas ginkgonis]RST30171.1 hypothetical protein HMF7854_04510 [Sphingomonas ginkgonis]
MLLWRTVFFLPGKVLDWMVGDLRKLWRTLTTEAPPGMCCSCHERPIQGEFGRCEDCENMIVW